MAPKNALVVLGITLASVGGALGLSRLGRTGPPESALGLAPAGASLVVHVDAPALLGSPIWEALAEGDRGLDAVREACGFDPLARLASVDVFVVGTTRHPLDQIGFVARGDLDRESLVRCVEVVVEADGGGVHGTEIEGEPALASDHGASRAAFLAPDRVVAGEEVMVRQILRVEHGTARGASDDPVLAHLWSQVQTRDELVAVMHLPASWRRSILDLVEGMPDLDGLGAIESIGLGARIRRGLGATLVLALESEADAEDLEAAILARLEDARGDLLVRLSTIGGALRHVEVEAHGAELMITADLDEEELEAVVALAREALDRTLAPTAPEGPLEDAPRIELPAPDVLIEAGEPSEATAPTPTAEEPAPAAEPTAAPEPTAP